MKNLKLLSVAMILSLLLFACDDKENSDFFIEFDKEKISFSAVQDITETIVISSSSNWGLDTELPEWLGISNFVGHESPMTITLEAAPNTEMDKREITLTFSNSQDVSRSIKITQLGLAESAPFIKFSKESLLLPIEGGTKDIEITTNRAWEITNIPEWITINSKTGSKSQRIVIGANDNDLIERREAILTFKTKDGKAETTLSVQQSGRRDILQIPSLPIFQHILTSLDDLGNYYTETKSAFVYPSMRDKIFLGSLINTHTNDFPTFTNFTNYTFYPITASTEALIDSPAKTFVPSLQEQETLAAEITANLLGKSAKVTNILSPPTSFPTHRVLYSIGWANLGIPLDEIVSGKSYKEQEMQYKNGMIFSFKHTLFSLEMDIPDKLIKEELNDEDLTIDMSYICRMDYGKVGLLIVETDAKYERMKRAVRNILIDKENNIHQAEDDALIEAANIAYVYFNNKNEMQVNRNKKEAIEAYKAAFYNKKDRENIYPIGFWASDLVKHTPKEINFKFKASK